MYTYEHISMPYFMYTEYGIDHMAAHSHDTSWSQNLKKMSAWLLYIHRLYIFLLMIMYWHYLF